MSETIELERSVPVVADVDVLVAGGGIAGCAAALTAARNGARTMIVDRFGTLGGNMGPGMFSGGVLHLVLDHPEVMMEGLKGIAGEFIDRCEAFGDGQLGHRSRYFRDSQAVSYVWLKLMEENDVQLMLNSYACDPIMEGQRVVGLVVENKSGTQAIRAQVVVDATGDADVAMRAGAPVDAGAGYFFPGMYFAVANVDESRYLAFLEQVGDPDPDDLQWARDIFERTHGKFVPRLNPLIKFYRQAWELGEYTIVGKIGDLATVTADHGLYEPTHGIVGAQVGLRTKGQGHSGDAAMMNALEVGSRKYIFSTAQFLRRHVPGFEDSYLHMIAPYFHSRGGRSAVPEVQITEQDVAEARRFDDVIFINYPCDFPYRQLLPRRVEGLLMAGRSAIIQPPSMRNRWKCLLMGQAAGLAAALAAGAHITPREVNVNELQTVLYFKYQAPLGDRERLQELGLAVT